MPKVDRDDPLLERVTAFVDSSGSAGAASRKLGMDRATLWRFVKTGCAISRTRERLVQQLNVIESETKSASRSLSGKSRDVEALPLEELRGMRDMCKRVLAWVDEIEPQLIAAANSQSMGAVKTYGQWR